MSFKIGSKVQFKEDYKANGKIYKAGARGTLKNFYDNRMTDNFADIEMEEDSKIIGRYLIGLELAEDKTSEAYLQSLVNKANEGEEAQREMIRLAKTRFEFIQAERGNDNWEVLDFDEKLLFKFRLTPPKPRERKFRLQDWDVVIQAHTTTIGCQTFDSSELAKDLKSLTVFHVSNRKLTFDLRSARNGIRFQDHTLTWENADKLLAELESFEKERK